jgi:hypothetical protein
MTTIELGIALIALPFRNNGCSILVAPAISAARQRLLLLWQCFAAQSPSWFVRSITLSVPGANDVGFVG